MRRGGGKATAVRTGGAATITLGAGGLTTTHWAFATKHPDTRTREINAFFMIIAFPLRRSGRRENTCVGDETGISANESSGY